MEGWALVGGAALMGAAGLPHCVAMCAAPCALAAAGPRHQLCFQLARVAGYAAAGAVAAAGVNALHDWVALSPALRPLWTLLQLAALALGAWLMWQGRLPLSLQGTPAAALPAGGWHRMRGPGQAAAAGALWIAWPCALSQSALLVSSLAPTPAVGALAMGMFATVSSPALWLVPAVLARRQGVPLSWATATRGVRLGGALMASAAVWALGHGIWAQAAAWCSARGWGG